MCKFSMALIYYAMEVPNFTVVSSGCFSRIFLTEASLPGTDFGGIPLTRGRRSYRADAWLGTSRRVITVLVHPPPYDIKRVGRWSPRPPSQSPPDRPRGTSPPGGQAIRPPALQQYRV